MEYMALVQAVVDTLGFTDIADVSESVDSAGTPEVRVQFGKRDYVLLNEEDNPSSESIAAYLGKCFSDAENRAARRKQVLIASSGSFIVGASLASAAAWAIGNIVSFREWL